MNKATRRLRALWAGWQPLVPMVITAILVIAVAGGLTAWWTARAVPEGVLKCSYGYADAKTARDTARVDAWEVSSPGKARPVNCGVFRIGDSLRQVDGRMGPP